MGEEARICFDGIKSACLKHQMDVVAFHGTDSVIKNQSELAGLLEKLPLAARIKEAVLAVNGKDLHPVQLDQMLLTFKDTGKPLEPAKAYSVRPEEGLSACWFTRKACDACTFPHPGTE